MTEAFVPRDFDVPLTFRADGFLLEPLGPEHNERDHAAWMSSMEHIHATPGFDSTDRRWPVEMSLEENLGDMNMHADHFAERSGFTYSILDGDDVIGCLYIYPSDDPGADADVRSWVTERRAEMDAVVWEAVTSWLATTWPFTNPSYAPRT